MDLKPFRWSNDALNDAGELRRRLDADGYVFLKRLQNPDMLLALRRDILQVCMAGGWLVKGSDPMDGIADISAQCTEGDIEYTDVYHRIYRLESFHRAAHAPEVIGVMEKLVDGPVLPHPQKIARLWFPQYTAHTTPIHQDYVHFQGTYDTYTCWAPAGDCPVELGGLAILPGSHRINAVREHHFSLGAGSLAIDQMELPDEWVTTDYEVGDSLIFHSLTVHQALPNVTKDRLRVSLDNRYQAVDQPIAEHMLQPHLQGHHPITWDEVYQDWASTDLQYYWRDLNLDAAARIETWSAQGFGEALALARQGDPNAVHHLRRLIKRDPASALALQAADALAQATNRPPLPSAPTVGP